MNVYDKFAELVGSAEQVENFAVWYHCRYVNSLSVLELFDAVKDSSYMFSLERFKNECNMYMNEPDEWELLVKLYEQFKEQVK